MTNNANNNALEYHKRVTHESDGQKSICDDCGAQFSSETNTIITFTKKKLIIPRMSVIHVERFLPGKIIYIDTKEISIRN